MPPTLLLYGISLNWRRPRADLDRTPASWLTANSHADIPSAVADLGHQNEDKRHEDQGDDPRPSCKMSPSTLI